ncbi:MAG: hypothetical protein GEU92_10015 [Alphaproteobacteria bacterium]|nr:hypothetical protein [Alphaproteobacteria bacterium]
MTRGSKKWLSVAAAALLLGAPASGIAQGTPGGAETVVKTEDFQIKSLRELDDDSPTQWNGLSVDRLEDMKIVNAAGKEIGEIEEILADASGGIVAVTAEVGGFLGIGEKEVVVALEHLALQGDRFMSSLSSEQLKAMPRWDDD